MESHDAIQGVTRQNYKRKLKKKPSEKNGVYSPSTCDALNNNCLSPTKIHSNNKIENADENDVPNKQRKSTILLQLKSDFNPKYLESMKVEDGRKSRYGRLVRNRYENDFTIHKFKQEASPRVKVEPMLTPSEVHSSQPHTDNVKQSRKVRYISSIKTIPLNPNLRLIQSHQEFNQQMLNSPLYKLIEFNKIRINNKFQDDNNLLATETSIEVCKPGKSISNSCSDVNEDIKPPIQTNIVELQEEIDDKKPLLEMIDSKCKKEFDNETKDEKTAIHKFVDGAVENNCVCIVSIEKFDMNDLADSIESTQSHNASNKEQDLDEEEQMELDEPSNDAIIQTTGDEWNLGEIVWASLGKYPFWPAVIHGTDLNEFQTENKVHVEFFGDQGSTSWINKKSSLLKYNGLAEYETRREAILNSSNCTKSEIKRLRQIYSLPVQRSKWKLAVAEADLLVQISIKHRIPFYDEVLRPLMLNLPLPESKHDEHNLIYQFELNDRFKTSTPCTFDTAYSSMKQSVSTASLSPAFEDDMERSHDQYQQDVNKTKRIENYLLSVAENKQKINIDLIEDDAVPSTSKNVSPVNSFLIDNLSIDRSNCFVDLLRDRIEKHFNTNIIVDGGDEQFRNAALNIWLVKPHKEPKKRKRQIIPDKSEIEVKKLRRHCLPVNISRKIRPTQELTNGNSMCSVETNEDPKTEKAKLKLKKLKQKEEEKLLRMQKKEETFSAFIIKKYPNNFLFKDISKDVVCQHCLQPDNVLRCSGKCSGYFHRYCSVDPSSNTSKDWYACYQARERNEASINLVTGEDFIAPSTLSGTIDTNFICNNCIAEKMPNCFVCSKDDGEIVRCDEKQCGRAYHLSCLKYWPQHKRNYSANKKTRSFLCPCHVCQTCISEDPRGLSFNIENERKLMKCVLCPGTYHRISSCIPAGSELLSESQLVCPRHRLNRRPPVNVDWCFLCSAGGSLLCCEQCPSAVHQECLKLQPAEHYICEECESGRLPLYGEIVWAKFSHLKWWPGMLVPPTKIPENLLKIKPSSNYFCICFFGTHNYAWLCRDYVYLYQEDDADFNVENQMKSKTSLSKAIEEAKKWHKIIKDTEVKYFDPKRQNNLKPMPYIKIKSNRAIPPVKFENNENSYTECECQPTDESPCGPQSNCINFILSCECNATCQAGVQCQNQRFEKKIYPKVELKRFESRGWGLITLEDIPVNTFIIEYVGEVIDSEEFDRRFVRAIQDKAENFYFLTLRHKLYIDAGRRGNNARFINHSCDPNCVPQKWTVYGQTRIGLFSKVDIAANTELTFDYNWCDIVGNKTVCRCGTEKCSGFIGMKSKRTLVDASPEAESSSKKKFKSKTKKEDEKSRKEFSARSTNMAKSNSKSVADVVNVNTFTEKFVLH